MSLGRNNIDFVFLDLDKKPYRCTIWGGQPWLFYWHKDKKWVSLRAINQTEIDNYKQLELPKEHQDLYYQKHKNITNIERIHELLNDEKYAPLWLFYDSFKCLSDKDQEILISKYEQHLKQEEIWENGRSFT